ncbi:hypothetical protein BO99DRAFT_62534 [Aspergillus violaceofuscus CBS 115571]|uniref:Uncharacterized protein n=1 Tax=Aspergillus violaceofuscus (strain CBS 115571) TaxID=1450538 RepID=A0A2V5HBK0_ASPV1|nr:hypothetical protein BO99DRAFT_62534 [Aspergillus violaceofuscus CBS 115571]
MCFPGRASLFTVAYVSECTGSKWFDHGAMINQARSSDHPNLSNHPSIIQHQIQKELSGGALMKDLSSCASERKAESKDRSAADKPLLCCTPGTWKGFSSTSQTLP